MNLAETARLLAAMAAFDRRTVGTSDVAAWQTVLADIAYADALEAVRRHYRDSTEWMMPAMVRAGVRQVEHERASSPWAPGQYGVPREEVVPEARTTGRLQLGDLPTNMRELIGRVRAMLPDGSREALHGRRVAWEREHRTYLRTTTAEPNPHYRPGLIDMHVPPPCASNLEPDDLPLDFRD